jgi:PGF-pre-PGF domain-containing protein
MKGSFVLLLVGALLLAYSLYSFGVASTSQSTVQIAKTIAPHVSYGEAFQSAAPLPLTTPILASSPNLPNSSEVGQTITFTASWSGGNSTYSANYTIFNLKTGEVVAGALYTGIAGTSNSFGWTIPGSAAGNQFAATVIVTDSSPIKEVEDSASTWILTVPLVNGTFSFKAVGAVTQSLQLGGTLSVNTTDNFSIGAHFASNPANLVGNIYLEKLVNGTPYFINGTQINSTNEDLLRPNFTGTTNETEDYDLPVGEYRFVWNDSDGDFKTTIDVNRTSAKSQAPISSLTVNIIPSNAVTTNVVSANIQVSRMTRIAGGLKGTVKLSNKSAHIRAGHGSVLKNLSVRFENYTDGINQFNISIVNESYPINRSLPTLARPVYQYIQINQSAYNSTDSIDPYVQNVTYNFTVNQSWVAQQNISGTAVSLFKYEGGGWISLPTSFEGQNSTSYFYSAVSNSFSGYAVSYSAPSNTANTGNIIVSLPTGYTTYFYAGAGGNVLGVSLNSITWNGFVASNMLVNSLGANNLASVGWENSPLTSNQAAFKFTSVIGTNADNAVLIGVGANVLPNGGKLFGANIANVGTTNTLSFTFSTTTVNSYVIILAAISNSVNSVNANWITTNAGTVSTSNFAQNSFIFNSIGGLGSGGAAAGILIYNGLITGTYNVIIKSQSANAVIAAEAFVFPTYAVTLKTTPSTENIISNGITQTSGNVINVIGGSTVNAIAQPGFVFDNWIASVAANVIFGSSTSANTFITVEGSVTLTANFIANTIFEETGLPPSTSWNVVYNGVTANNQLSPNNANVVFTANWVQSVGYTVARQIVGGYTFTPNIITGNLVPSNTYNINFIQDCLTCTISESSVSNTVSNGANVFLANPIGYDIYFYAGASNTISNALGPSFSYTDVSSAKIAAGSIWRNATVGYATSNTGSFNGINSNNILMGFGANLTEVNAKVFVANSGAAKVGANERESVTFNVFTDNSFAIVLGSISNSTGAATPLTSNAAGCTTIGNQNNIAEWAGIMTCNNLQVGTYTANVASTTTNAAIAISVFVFPSYSVTLKDIASSGNILINGEDQASGNIIGIVGFNAVNAIPPSGDLFSSWSVSNSLNFTFSNILSANTFITALGNGIVTADYNTIAVTTFNEVGLPASTPWNVIFDGVLLSNTPSVPGNVVFSTDQGAFSYTIANQLVGGTTYAPNTVSGTINAGNTVSVSFTGSSAVCEISLSNTAINFGTGIQPGSTISTANAVTDTNGGSVQGWIAVNGMDWTSASNTIGLGNTVWSGSSGVSVASANALTSTLTNTLIVVPASGSNTIYFGFNAPGGTPAGTYSQNIVLETFC